MKYHADKFFVIVTIKIWSVLLPLDLPQEEYLFSAIQAVTVYISGLITKYC